MDPAIVVALISLVGTVVTAAVAARGKRAGAFADEGQGFKARVDATFAVLDGTLESLSEQLQAEQDRRIKLEEKVARLEYEQRVARRYERMLLQHIYDRLPPPPPPRPTEP